MDNQDACSRKLSETINRLESQKWQLSSDLPYQTTQRAVHQHIGKGIDIGWRDGCRKTAGSRIVHNRLKTLSDSGRVIIYYGSDVAHAVVNNHIPNHIRLIFFHTHVVDQPIILECRNTLNCAIIELGLGRNSYPLDTPVS